MAFLPVELYTEIIHHLPPSRRPVLLGVSRLLHDIAIRFVFSTVKIYLMHGASGFYMLNTENERYVTETSDYFLRRSWDILFHIITKPSFAQVVRTLSVHAFTDGPAVFEQRTLAQALQSLHHLQSFHYFGDCPDFSTVAAYLPSTLKVLRIQSMPDSQLLDHLDHLRFLQPAIPFTYVRDQKLDQIFGEWERESGNSRDFVSVIETNPIQELAILSSHVALLPIRICNTLTQLDICVTLASGELGGIELVFRHALFLESLSLVGYIEPSFLAELPRHPEVLPRLTCFRLSCEFWGHNATEVNIPFLTEFLSHRPSLRRLYIRLPGIRLDIALALATVIGKLENLKVLGLHAGYEPLHEAAAFHLADQLSVNIEALQLTLPWLHDLHMLTWYPLLSKLQQFPRLTFLHLFSSGEDAVPISPVELATDLEHLRLVGLQRSLFTIDREDGEELEPKPWTPWSVKYCLPEDFICPDHAWLFRYH